MKVIRDPFKIVKPVFYSFTNAETLSHIELSYRVYKTRIANLVAYRVLNAWGFRPINTVTEIQTVLKTCFRHKF